MAKSNGVLAWNRAIASAIRVWRSLPSPKSPNASTRTLRRLAPLIVNGGGASRRKWGRLWPGGEHLVALDLAQHPLARRGIALAGREPAVQQADDLCPWRRAAGCTRRRGRRRPMGRRSRRARARRSHPAGPPSAAPSGSASCRRARPCRPARARRDRPPPAAAAVRRRWWRAAVNARTDPARRRRPDRARARPPARAPIVAGA